MGFRARIEYDSTTMNDDLWHLRLLSIFHYVVAVITALLGCIPIFHLVFGIAIVSGTIPIEDPAYSAFAGWIIVSFAGIVMTAMWSYAVALRFAARFLHEHRRLPFCAGIAAVGCIFMPFGTVLGVVTIVVLLRRSVQQLFDEDGISMAASVS